MKSPLSEPVQPSSLTRRVVKQDNFFQRAEVLKRNREKRNLHGQCVVEGVTPISLAVKHGWTIESFLYQSDRALSSWASGLLSSGIAREVWELTPELMAMLSDKDEPSELLAIVETRKLKPEAIPMRERGLVVAFDRPSSPGNLGSSLRSADAFNVDGAFITGHAVDIYDPYVIRASVGALFGLPVSAAASHDDVSEWVARARAAGFDYQVVGSSAKAELSICEHDFSRPTVLVLGNETVGMSRGYWEMSDSIVRIPINGQLSSINITCAASILLYEANRQRATLGAK